MSEAQLLQPAAEDLGARARSSNELTSQLSLTVGGARKQVPRKQVPACGGSACQRRVITALSELCPAASAREPTRPPARLPASVAWQPVSLSVRLRAAAPRLFSHERVRGAATLAYRTGDEHHDHDLHPAHLRAQRLRPAHACSAARSNCRCARAGARRARGKLKGVQGARSAAAVRARACACVIVAMEETQPWMLFPKRSLFFEIRLRTPTVYGVATFHLAFLERFPRIRPTVLLPYWVQGLLV